MFEEEVAMLPAINNEVWCGDRPMTARKRSPLEQARHNKCKSVEKARAEGDLEILRLMMEEATAGLEKLADYSECEASPVQAAKLRKARAVETARARGNVEILTLQIDEAKERLAWASTN